MFSFNRFTTTPNSIQLSWKSARKWSQQVLLCAVLETLGKVKVIENGVKWQKAKMPISMADMKEFGRKSLHAAFNVNIFAMQEGQLGSQINRIHMDKKTEKFWSNKLNNLRQSGIKWQKSMMPISMVYIWKNLKEQKRAYKVQH